MTKEQSQLADALKQARSKPMFFAFVAKGNEGRLLVDKNKVLPKAVDDAKKSTGGGTIFKGRCLMEEATLVFEVPTEPKIPAETLAALIRKIIKNDIGQTHKVVVRVNAQLLEGEEGEAEAAEGAAPSGTAPPPPPLPSPTATPPHAPPADAQKAAVLKRLNALSGAINTAMAGPNEARVKTLFLGVNKAIQGGDFVLAGKALDQLTPLVAGAGTVPPPPPPPTPQATGTAPPSPPPQAVPANVVEQLREALEAWEFASDTVDHQITQLQKALRETDDKELAEIAEFGLNAMSGNYRVRLKACLRELKAGGDAGLRQNAKKALPIVHGLHEHLDTEPRVAACDANPFGVNMTIRKTMGGALSQLATAFQQVVNS